MCAIDALGISAMLDRPVAVRSTEPDTANTITVQVDHDRARWSPATTVVFAGAIDDACGPACCPSVDRTCGHINFVTTPQAAHRWAARHPHVSGVLLDRHQAITQGVAEFGALLRDSAEPQAGPR